LPLNECWIGPCATIKLFTFLLNCCAGELIAVNTLSAAEENIASELAELGKAQAFRAG
jgi:hypothetical protein